VRWITYRCNPSVAIPPAPLRTTGTFGITTPINGAPATHGNGSTVGFAVQSPEQGNAFHAAGLAHGGTTCEDPPGFREGPSGKIYLAYLRDPDGNKICALHRPAK
jgi:catechol 2,3-dioxygenase-like lactoylglutathione lyase family enzyme